MLWAIAATGGKHAPGRRAARKVANPLLSCVHVAEVHQAAGGALEQVWAAARFSMDTSEAERIAVDQAAKTLPASHQSATGQGEQTARAFLSGAGLL